MAEHVTRHDRWLEKTILPFIPPYLTPNQVTAFRLIMTPAVVWAIYSGHYVLGLTLFLFLAFTDALDGSMARLRDRVTDLGRLWDPVADKVLVGATAAVLIIEHFPVELAILIFATEAIFIIAGYYRKRQGRIVSANRWGKLKMLHQVLGMTLFMLALIHGIDMLAVVSYGVFIIATLFAIISLFTQGL